MLIEDSHENIDILQAEQIEWKNCIIRNVHEYFEDSCQKVVYVWGLIT